VVTTDIAVAILGFAVVLACVSVLWSALVLVGGLLSIVRDDHRNPVARAWLDWYAGHRSRRQIDVRSGDQRSKSAASVSERQQLAAVIVMIWAIPVGIAVDVGSGDALLGAMIAAFMLILGGVAAP
jgi:hypothetical protein